LTGDGGRETVDRRIGVLISGRGSNLQAIIDAIGDGRLRATIAVVISNVRDAPGLVHAQAAGIETVVLSHMDWRTRDEYDRALVEQLQRRRVNLVCLAGFMRLLSGTFLDAFPNRVLNIHPSLLPAFPGRHAQRQALQHGVKITGATVHFVNTELDAGPIVMQSAVPVLPTDTAESLSTRILRQEHRLYPEAIELVLNGGWQIEGRKFVVSAIQHTS
jgi:phosphoribosylglycinamide formyltransferase-1